MPDDAGFSSDFAEWSQPLDFLAEQDSAAPQLRPDHLPAVLYDIAVDTAERLGVEPAAVALCCIVACASVISDDWRVRPKRHDWTWTESPRLWGAIVGDPSILKSPVISACTKPIDKLSAEARARHDEAMQVYKLGLAAAKADKSGATPEPSMPKLDRYLIEGATMEAISEVLRDDEGARQRAPARKVLCRQDEMSEFFANLDRYAAGGKGGGDRGAYLRLFNGGSYTVDRIGRGTFSVPNWSACFLGGIQPGPIQRIAKAAAEDGLLQRFVYIVPGAQEQGRDQAPNRGAHDRYNALFPALAALHPPRTADGEHHEAVTLHSDAHVHREGLDASARALAAMPDTSGRLKAALGKYPGLFARIALTLHLIEIGDARACGRPAPPLRVIAEPTARQAAEFIRDVLLPHLLRADALMFATEQTGHAKWIAGHILAHQLTRITSRDVVRAYGALRAPEARSEMAAVMDSLVTIGWLEPETPNNAIKPVSAWMVNPAVLSMHGAKADAERSRRAAVRGALLSSAHASLADSAGCPH